MLESYSLQVNESSLTGESTNVDKKAVQLEEDKVALADQVNMVFSSSLVTLGRGVVVVTGTGDEHGDRQDRVPDERHQGEEDSPAGELGPVQQQAGGGDHGDLRHRVPAEPVPADGPSWTP